MSMDIIVNEAQGLSDKAYLSIRVADARRQVHYKPGECFHFEPQKMPRHFMVDIFEKIGSKQVSLLDLETAGASSYGTVEVPHTDGASTMKLDLKVQIKEQETPDSKAKRTSRHQSALKAKSYLDNLNVQRVLQGMVHGLLTIQPENPSEFMLNYLKEHQDECNSRPTSPSPFKVDKAPAAMLEPKNLERALAEQAKALPEEGAEPRSGLGETELAGRFAADGSQPLPDLKGYNNILASVLREKPEAYEQLKDVRTKLGVSLARCIKTGVDNKGHKMIRTAGLVAGDEYCFDAFKDVFTPVILSWHRQDALVIPHPQDFDPSKVSDEPLDASGKYAVAVEVRACRSLSGLRMPPTIQRAERQEVERVIVKALLELGDDFKGSYNPLRGSRSYVPMDQGMDAAREGELRSRNLLFEEPDAAVVLSSGFGRHWPEGRGVFTSDDHQFAVWINEMEHIRMCCRAPGGRLQEAFRRCAQAETALGDRLKEAGYSFARSDSLGFLAACPANLGTGLDVGVTLHLPLLGKRSDFKVFCKSLDLNVRIYAESEILAIAGSSADTSSHDYWCVSSATVFGISAVEQVNVVLSGCRNLLELEARLETGADLGPLGAEEAEDEEPPGLGDEDFPGFPAEKCPEEMPDLSAKHSMGAHVLSADPSIYTRLRHKRTRLGVSFARCIKPAIDSNGHRMIKTVGAVAGDGECYEIFREFFDPVIALRHPAYDPNSDHPVDTDVSKVSDAPLELPGSSRVISVRVRASRNLSGIRMLPACSIAERRQVEKLLVQALGELAEGEGDYFPLAGSDSYAAKPGGMSEEEEELLRDAQLVFDAPDSEVLLSSGMGRHWPDARGVFASGGTSSSASQPRIAAVVNEEDHLRLVAAEQGSDLRGAFERLVRAHAAIEASLKKSGKGFAYSQRLGYLGSSPATLGTCLAASVVLRVPLLASQPNFRALCRSFGLQAHFGAVAGLPEEGLWEISNTQRLGSSECEQVNAVLEGCRQLLRFEERLENGETVDFEDELGPLPASRAVSRNVTPAAAHDVVVPEREISFHERPGLGADDFPGFPTDECPAEMPDLSKHHSLLAEVLRRDPSLYEQLRGLRTDFGVTLARCIKTGMDNCGHPMIKTVGAVAGDAQCYDTFRPLFDAIVQARNKGHNFEDVQVSDLDWNKLSKEPLDQQGDRVCAVRIRAGRNLQGFRMPPAILQEERREVEKLLTGVLMSCDGELAGDYFPLTSSRSFPAKPQGMSEDDESELHDAGLLFQEPDAPMVLSSGTGRDWPDARGVFATPDQGFAVWINEEDHLRLISSQEDGDLQAAFSRFCAAESAIRAGVKAASHDFAWSSRLGFLAACPGNLGTGLRVEIVVKLPLFGAQLGFRKFCRELGVQARAANAFGEGAWEVSNQDRLGTTEVELVESVATAVRRLLAEEAALAGEAEATGPSDSDVDGRVADKLVHGLLSSPDPKASAPEPSAPAAAPEASAPEPSAPPKADPKDTDFRKKAKAAFMEASKNGALEAALAKRQQGKQHPPKAEANVSRKDTLGVKKKARDQLIASSKSGALKAALASKPQAKQDAALDDVPGYGDEEVPGFPADVCPEELPDLSAHHNLMAQVLQREPEIYARLRGLKSEYGTGLAKCIKMGVDCHGHPMIRTVGVVAGDEDCYNVFRDLFDPIIAIRHAKHSGDAAHSTELDAAKVDAEKIDPSGKYVISCRLRAVRNVHGVPFPPAVSVEQRREVEGLLSGALSQLSGPLAGNYLALASMNQQQQADLERDGLLFQEPDASLLLSAGIGRNWPNARGVFANEAHSFTAWVNNEDHLRLVVTTEADALQEAFGNFCNFESSVRAALKQEGRDFAWSERLGFLTSCPSNLGPGGFRISLLMRLPLLSAQPNFKAVCRELELQVRPAQTEAWGMLWSIVGNGRLGLSEAQLVNHMATSCRKLIEKEVALELGGQP